LKWNGTEFGLAWTDYRNAGNREVYFRRLSATGAPLGGEVRVTNDAADSAWPDLSWNDQDREWAIVWHDTRDGNAEVYFTRLSATGQKVGSDMRLDPGQTFDVAREDPPTRTTARIRNGVIEAGPFDLPLPFAALDARFILDLRGARIRATVRPDGSLAGIIGGGVPAVPFGETLIRYGIGADLQQTLVGTLRLFSDLAPNDSGMCTQISAGLRFETRTAFVNP
jgi:hypothetical protein